MLTVRVEACTRWDALALTRKLTRYHWFLIEPDAEHWDICVPLEEHSQGDLPGDLERRVLEWLDERGLSAATIRTETRDFILKAE